MLARWLYISTGAIVAIVTALPHAGAQEQVRVQLTSGRIVQGEIDARSDERQLWLRRGAAEATLVRPIAWDVIQQAYISDKSIVLDELKTRAIAVTDEAPAEPAIKQPRWRGVFAIPNPNVSPAPPPLPAVRSVAIDGFHANWDADVESDGLVLQVFPLDANGIIVPVHGALEVELIAPEVRRFQDAPHGRGLTLERLGQWMVALHPQDFSSNGYRVELPFQAVHPEFDTKILPHGLVDARLVVPGQGTFDTAEEFIRLRPWSLLRDQYWRDTGRRFFPREQTGRSKRGD